MQRFSPSFFSVLAEVVRGKSVSRTLSNLFWRGLPQIDGQILDIGVGDGRASHYRFLPIAAGAAICTVDVEARPGTDFVLDISREQVPLLDGSQDYIFLFNILEHLDSHDRVLAEARRLLRPGGKILGSVPFLINVHPDPHDYLRFTEEALRGLFVRNGFRMEAVEPIGRGPFLAAYEQLDMLLPRLAHPFLLAPVWFLDFAIQRLRRHRDFRGQFPLAYDFIAER